MRFNPGSPIPHWLERSTRMYGPSADVRMVAAQVAERAWERHGVRVYGWPCGSLALVRVACTADALLLKHCGEALIGTWAHGATLVQVLDTLRWARRRA